MYIQIQWNPSNVDTVGTLSECPDWRGVLISGAVLYTQDTFGTTSSVHITLKLMVVAGRDPREGIFLSLGLIVSWLLAVAYTITVPAPLDSLSLQKGAS